MNTLAFTVFFASKKRAISNNAELQPFASARIYFPVRNKTLPELPKKDTNHSLICMKINTNAISLCNLAQTTNSLWTSLILLLLGKKRYLSHLIATFSESFFDCAVWLGLTSLEMKCFYPLEHPIRWKKGIKGKMYEANLNYVFFFNYDLRRKCQII